MLVFLAEIVGLERDSDPCIDNGLVLADRDVVPMALIFCQVAKPLIRIEEDILVPGVSDALDFDTSPQKAKDVVICPTNLSPGSERNERRIHGRNSLEGL